MARSRNIKPNFFRNEVLAEMPFQFRLLFIGLWGIADREGRVEDRPRRIKADIFPYDDVDVDAGLQQLSAGGFITRYEVEGIRCLEIVKFKEHQNPHIKEAPSVLPSNSKASTGNSGASPSDSLLPLTDSPIPQHNGRAGRFADFWKAYPKKVKRKTSEEIWKLKNLDPMADKLLEDIKIRLDEDLRWKKGFVPDPTTYLRQERWNDEISQ